MRIIYLANSRIPTEKAHGIQISKMCESFSRANIDLELVIPKRINPIKDNIFEFYSIKSKFKIKKIFNMDAINIIKNKFGFILQSVSFSISALIYLWFKKYKGVVYSRDYFSLFLLSFFKRFNLFYEVHTFPNNINFFYRFLLPRIKFVTITSGLKKELLKNNVKEENILVAHDGVDLDLFNKVNNNKVVLRDLLSLPKNKKIISYIGKLTTMGESKGVDLLISSFVQVLNKIPKTYLLLVGINKEEIEYIQNILKSFGINQDSYKLVMHVSHNKIVEYEKASDILIMSYPNTKHYRLYMSPLKMFEYMASGVPMVSSDLPSIREILNENNAILVKTDDSESLAEGIQRVLLNDYLSVSISSNALQDIKKYTWHNRANNILEFIRKF